MLLDSVMDPEPSAVSRPMPKGLLSCVRTTTFAPLSTARASSTPPLSSAASVTLVVSTVSKFPLSIMSVPPVLAGRSK